MPESKQPQASYLSVFFFIMFAFGIAVGYIIRDVRADEQARAAAAAAQEDVRTTTLEAFERLRRAGSDLAGGARAVAESTKSAVRELSGASQDSTKGSS